MSAPASTVSPLIEHQIFWLLVKKAYRRDDVSRVYLAVQAALAYGRESVDIGWLLGAMMPEGRRTQASVGESIGAEGLAYFHWLYEVELTSPGEADTHHYRFLRRADGAQTIAYLRTASNPKSLQFQQTYERQRRLLENKRAALVATTRWEKSR